MTIAEFKTLFNHEKPLIGMVHLAPLPGSPRFKLSIDQIIDRALGDALAVSQGGMEGVLIENFGDSPFHSNIVGPETVAAMTAIVREIKGTVSLPIGINVLRNDAKAALAIATVCGCDFIRINVHTGITATDQGIIEGYAAGTLRYREILKSDVLIFADVFVKHGRSMDQTHIGQAALDLVHRGMADGLIITGDATGSGISMADLHEVKTALPDTPAIAGSGIDPSNIEDSLPLADGFIVGTSIKVDGFTTNPVSKDRVEVIVGIRDRFVENNSSLKK